MMPAAADIDIFQEAFFAYTFSFLNRQFIFYKG